MPDAGLDSEYHPWLQRFNNNDHGVWTYKDSSMYEMYWEYTGKKTNSKFDQEIHLRKDAWVKYHE